MYVCTCVISGETILEWVCKQYASSTNIWKPLVVVGEEFER